MGRAVSTAEAGAFKALPIVRENPPSTLCSMAVIYAPASERAACGPQRRSSGLAEPALGSGGEHGRSRGRCHESEAAIFSIEPRVFNMQTGRRRAKIANIKATRIRLQLELERERETRDTLLMPVNTFQRDDNDLRNHRPDYIRLHPQIPRQTRRHELATGCDS